MTATLSGSDASMFTAAANLNNPGSWNLNTTQSFNFTSIFGLPVNGNYSGSLSLSWNVTDNGGLSPTIAQPISLTPVQVKSITAYHNASETTACNNAQTQANTTYYAIKNTGANMPMTAELFVGNRIYTNNKITTNLGAGYIVLENANGDFIPYAINSSGVITSVGSTCPTV